MDLITGLGEGRLATLRAACDRIIPRDDYPGAWDAGVGAFLAGLMEEFPELQDLYRAGLDGLEAEATTRHGSVFAQIGPDEQDEVLRSIERGETSAEWTVSAAEFFRKLMDQTMEGYYADPGNGGNRDGVAWRMIGFEVTV